MRKTVLAVTAMVLALVLGSGIAVAAAVSGTQGNDTLRGTRQVDQIYGLNGNDTLYGFERPDELYGGAGNDNVYGHDGADDLYGGSGIDNLFGGTGADFINSLDRSFDLINCGGADGARDTVVRDAGDAIRGCLGDNVN